MGEQLYVFVDKTGHCFESFQKKGDGEGAKRYYDHVGAWLLGGKTFTVGDMLAFRDDLVSAGFEWGKDFYVKKVTK